MGGVRMGGEGTGGECCEVQKILKIDPGACRQLTKLIEPPGFCPGMTPLLNNNICHLVA